ncbi:MAG: energy transducer TonB, partial [Alistipes sp.]|nr:energy transducer TonB [Alistipes sp.]
MKLHTTTLLLLALLWALALPSALFAQGGRTTTRPLFQNGPEDTFSEWVAGQLDLSPNPDGSESVPLLVRFTVDKKGTVGSIGVSSGDTLRHNIRAILGASPRWTPARRGRRALDASYYLVWRSPLDTLRLLPEEDAERVMPTFNGGDLNTFHDWVMTQLSYPPDALESGMEGEVRMEFRVNRLGETGAIKVIYSPGVPLTTEAARVIISSPLWTPGTIAGIPVNVRYIIPFRFRLQDAKRFQKPNSKTSYNPNPTARDRYKPPPKQNYPHP